MEGASEEIPTVYTLTTNTVYMAITHFLLYFLTSALIQGIWNLISINHYFRFGEKNVSFLYFPINYNMWGGGYSLLCAYHLNKKTECLKTKD